MDSLLRVRPPEKPQRIFGLHLKSTFVICYSLPFQSSCSNAVTGDTERRPVQLESMEWIRLHPRCGNHEQLA